MRTIRELRQQKHIGVPNNKDSLYKPIVRKYREFSALKIPKNLEKALPFKSQSINQKLTEKKKKKVKYGIPFLSRFHRPDEIPHKMFMTLKERKEYVLVVWVTVVGML